MKKSVILLFCSFAAVFAAFAQSPVRWHKTVPGAVLGATYCHVTPDGDRFLLHSNRDIIQIDQYGTVSGYLKYPSSTTPHINSVIKRNSGTGGAPYFLMVRRTASPAFRNYTLTAYRPGSGVFHEKEFVDSLSGLMLSKPRVLESDDQSLLVFGRKFYRKIQFSETTGFSEEWSRPLGFAPSAVIRQGNLFILADEGGLIVALDADGNTVWARQHDIRFRNLKATPDGFIACGSLITSSDGKILKLDANGEEQWSKTFSQREFNDIIPSAGGGYVAAGVSAQFDITLLKTDHAGNTVW